MSSHSRELFAKSDKSQKTERQKFTVDWINSHLNIAECFSAFHLLLMTLQVEACNDAAFCLVGLRFRITGNMLFCLVL